MLVADVGELGGASPVPSKEAEPAPTPDAADSDKPEMQNEAVVPPDYMFDCTTSRNNICLSSPCGIHMCS